MPRVQIEHGSTVVGEIELVLAVGHVDVMGEEEIRAEQHAGPHHLQSDVPDQDVRVLDPLPADLEFLNRRDPDIDRLASESEGLARRDDAGSVRCDPGAFRGAQGEDRARGPGIEEHVDVAAVQGGLGDQVRPPLGCPVEVDGPDGLCGGPVGERGAAAVPRLGEAQHAVREVVVDIRDPQQVLPQYAGDAALKVVVADEELRIMSRDARDRKPLGNCDLRDERAADAADGVPGRGILQRQLELRRHGGGQEIEEAPGIDHEPCVGPIDVGRDDRTQVVHPDGQWLGQGELAAAGRGSRRRKAGDGQQKRDPTESARQHQPSLHRPYALGDWRNRSAVVRRATLL